VRRLPAGGRHNETVTRVRKRLLAAMVTVTVLAAATVGATLWWRWDTRRQPQVTDVLAAMNTAVADAVVAAGPDAAVAVSPVVRAAQCRLGPLREGGVFTGKADLYVHPGTEDDLITTIERQLPARYATTRATAVAGVRALRADAGGTISVSVRKLSPGWLGVSARSACSLGAAAAPAAADGSGTGAATLTGLLQRLGTRPASITEQRVRCPAGDIVTLSAISETTATDDLIRRLTDVVPPGARTFTTVDANRVSYRDGAVSIVVAGSDDGTAVTAQHTTVC
jgi:hypothetical protein